MCRRLLVTGTVQGVGFRPFVHRLATELSLTGTVCNDRDGVRIEVEGATAALDEFSRRLLADPPPLARIEAVRTAAHPRVGHRDFTIVASRGSGPSASPVAADAGPCAACLAELTDPTARRHRYPFTNCTACGPRYTITTAIPYDRATTTMASFPLCADCTDEYTDPSDRRFHAEPIACPACGPTLRLTARGAEPLTGASALQATVRRLRGGQIVAVKGVGGFHLAVDAADEEAVAELRRRKARDDKPFAVLVADLSAARALSHLDDGAAAALASAARPIVLAPRRADGTPLASGVAPGLSDVGVLLPPSPLHHLLATDVGGPLVLTSGNHAHEPIVHRDEEAERAFVDLADAVLGHDRAIHIRCDDSVVRSHVAGGLQPVRRARGEAPAPLQLPVRSASHVLAVGGQLKNTVAVARDGLAFVSHHIGDLEHPATDAAFTQAIAHIRHLHGVRPQLVAHDLHPDYRSTMFAMDLDLPLAGVQHHHAHIAACLAEHGRAERVLGLAFDGVGYGTDGTLWGGEFLVADLVDAERVGHLVQVPQPGGDAAAREPWRMAVAWVQQVLGDERAAVEGERLDPRARALLQVARAPVTPRTSSVGRLFDAVAALLGCAPRATYEGQAAATLEALAAKVPDGAAPLLPWATDATGDLHLLDPGPLVTAIVDQRTAGADPAVLAAGFHRSLAAASAQLAAEIAVSRGIGTVALSGGVFQNRLLTGLVVTDLAARGIEVLVHRRVPPNDGGISFGQAAVATARTA